MKMLDLLPHNKCMLISSLALLLLRTLIPLCAACQHVTPHSDFADGALSDPSAAASCKCAASTEVLSTWSMVSLARRRRRLDLVSIDSGSSGTDLARLVGSSAAALVCASVHPCAVERRRTLMPPGL